MPTLAVDAILFDLDGTLVDESASYREAIRLAAEYVLGAPVAPREVAEVKQVPGLNNDWDATWALIAWRRHGTIVPPDEADRHSPLFHHVQNVFQTYYLGDHRWREMSQQEPPFGWNEPLIERETALISPSTLHWLRSFPVGIATSRPRAEALLALTQHHLDQVFSPDLLVAAGDTSFEKPHPEPLAELVRRIGCRQPVYVGDTINDALSAVAAGMPFILVGAEPLDYPDAEPSVTHRIADVNQLITLCVSSAQEPCPT